MTDADHEYVVDLIRRYPGDEWRLTCLAALEESIHFSMHEQSLWSAIERYRQLGRFRKDPEKHRRFVAWICRQCSSTEDSYEYYLFAAFRELNSGSRNALLDSIVQLWIEEAGIRDENRYEARKRVRTMLEEVHSCVRRRDVVLPKMAGLTAALSEAPSVAADMLDDAGCTDAELTNHLRSRKHWYGCWARGGDACR